MSSIYCGSKAALTQFARVVALEEIQKGVKVNIVSPGIVATEIVVTKDGTL